MVDKLPNIISEIKNRFKKELLYYSKELIEFDNEIIELELGKIKKKLTLIEKQEKIRILEYKKQETIKAIIDIKNKLKTYNII